MLIETVKHPRTTLQSLRASVSILNVQDSKIRKRLNKHDLFTTESLFSLKKENGSTAEVCKITPEQTKNFWKKSSGQVRRSGDVCPKCISPHLAKTKCIIWWVLWSHSQGYIQPCSHSADHELLRIPKYSKVKCQVICPTEKV